MAPQDQRRAAPASLTCLSGSQRSQATLVSSAAKRPNPGHEQNVFCGQTDPRDPTCASGKEMDRYVNFSNAHQNQVLVGLETSSVSISRLEERYCRAPGPWSLASPFTRVKAEPWVSTLVISGNLVLFSFFVFSWLHCAACRILVPQLGVKPQDPGSESSES